MTKEEAWRIINEAKNWKSPHEDPTLKHITSLRERERIEELRIEALKNAWKLLKD